MHPTSKTIIDDVKREAMIGDLEIIHELFMHSEDIGEKRVQFFVGLLTVVGAIFSLNASDVLGGQDPELDRLLVMVVVLFMLLLFGLLTYLRLVRRNLVSDGYKAIASHRYAQLDLDDPFLPLKSLKQTKLTGGLTHFISLADGIILFFCLALLLLVCGFSLKTDFVWFLIVFLSASVFTTALWWFSEHSREKYRRELKCSYLRAKSWKEMSHESTG